jgi:hypothetical protein
VAAAALAARSELRPHDTLRPRRHRDDIHDSRHRQLHSTAAEGSEPRMRADLRIGDAGVRLPANNVPASWQPRMRAVVNDGQTVRAHRVVAAASKTRPLSQKLTCLAFPIKGYMIWDRRRFAMTRRQYISKITRPTITRGKLQTTIPTAVIIATTHMTIISRATRGLLYVPSIVDPPYVPVRIYMGSIVPH